MEDFAVILVTYNREDNAKRVLDALWKDRSTYFKELIIINDGTPYGDFQIPDPWESPGYPFIWGISHHKNYGVGVAKNNGLRKSYFETDLNHFFVIEDDILVTNPHVFEEYIKTSKLSGIRHYCYGLHGPANKDANSVPLSKLNVKYSEECGISLYQHSVGAFCYYHRSVLDKVGFMDERFVNAFEHVDHSYNIAKAGFIPGYWWWPDIMNSNNFLSEIACSEQSSVIRPRSDWRSNIELGWKLFEQKHGTSPVAVVPPSQEQVVTNLKQIKTKYAAS